MPRTALTVETIDVDGAFRAEANGDPTNDHSFVNDGGTLLLVRNADGANPHTVTLITPGTVSGLAIEDKAISIPASATRLIGPFPTGTFNQSGADAGNVFIDVDSTELKLTVYRLP